MERKLKIFLIIGISALTFAIGFYIFRLNKKVDLLEEIKRSDSNEILIYNLVLYNNHYGFDNSSNYQDLKKAGVKGDSLRLAYFLKYKPNE